MKRNTIYFLLVLFFIPIKFFAQEKQIVLNIKGRFYDEIILTNGQISIQGKTEDKSQWIFNIPDSIIETLDDLAFRYKILDINTEDFARYNIALVDIINKDTLSTLYINANENMILDLDYLKTVTVDNIPMSNPKGEYGFGSIYIDDFKVNSKPYSELKLRLQNPRFSVFGDENMTYEQQLDYYVQLCCENPNSRYLISSLSNFLNYYEDKSDVKKIYDSFSEENQKTYFGKKIKKHISSFNFKNEELLTPQGDRELIRQDTTKYALIVFSASWCGPCHKKIPLLKEIYNNTSDELEIVYLSMDEDTTKPEWIKLMTKEEIPWRSLFLDTEAKRIREEYIISTIPYALLVSPEGVAEGFEIREKEVEDLYQMLKVTKNDK